MVFVKLFDVAIFALGNIREAHTVRITRELYGAHSGKFPLIFHEFSNEKVSLPVRLFAVYPLLFVGAEGADHSHRGRAVLREYGSDQRCYGAVY